MDISRPADYFIACYTVLMRPNKVETAVHGCNCWLSARGGGRVLPYKGLMGTWGQPRYVFQDFCLKQGIEFIIFSAECTIGMVWGLTALKHYGNKV